METRVGKKIGKNSCRKKLVQEKSSYMKVLTLMIFRGEDWDDYFCVFWFFCFQLYINKNNHQSQTHNQICFQDAFYESSSFILPHTLFFFLTQKVAFSAHISIPWLLFAAAVQQYYIWSLYQYTKSFFLLFCGCIIQYFTLWINCTLFQPISY